MRGKEKGGTSALQKNGGREGDRRRQGPRLSPSRSPPTQSAEEAKASGVECRSWILTASDAERERERERERDSDREREKSDVLGA